MISETPKNSGNNPADRPTEHHYQHDPDRTELERVLNKGLQKIEPYSNFILLGILVATVVAVAVIFMIRSSRASQSEGWKRFIACRVPDDYAKLADAFPGTELAAWARLQQARGQLREGLDTALTNRSVSDDNLNSAREAFESLLKQSPPVPERVREEALYGLATCLEALSDGNNEPAIQAYEELIQAYPDSVHRAWAEERVEALKKGGAQEFYAWFRQQKPSPADRPLPEDFPASLQSPLDLSSPIFNLPSSSSSPASEQPQGGVSDESTPPSAPQPEPVQESPPSQEQSPEDTSPPAAPQPSPEGSAQPATAPAGESKQD